MEAGNQALLSLPAVLINMGLPGWKIKAYGALIRRKLDCGQIVRVIGA